MVHPIWYVVSLGVAIGTVLFAYYNNAPRTHERHQNNTRWDYPSYDSAGVDATQSTCSICLNTIQSNQISKLNCGHAFHKVCIEKWFEHCRPHFCPNCRKYN